jgi:hypothetical protein
MSIDFSSMARSEGASEVPNELGIAAEFFGLMVWETVGGADRELGNQC